MYKEIEQMRRVIQNSLFHVAQIARVMGVARQTLSSWLNHKNKMPLKRVYQLQQILKDLYLS